MSYISSKQIFAYGGGTLSVLGGATMVGVGAAFTAGATMAALAASGAALAMLGIVAVIYLYRTGSQSRQYVFLQRGPTQMQFHASIELDNRSISISPPPQQNLALVPVVVSQVAQVHVVAQHIFMFLPEGDLISAEHVCKAWKRAASDNLVWKYPCDREGIPPIRRGIVMDPRTNMPVLDPKTKKPIPLVLYKEAYKHLYPIIFGPKQYSDFLRVRVHGKIVPLQENIHEMLDQIDPTSQRKYRLLYLSSRVERTNSNGFSSVSKMSVNLLGELMQAPGVQNPTKYNNLRGSIRKQHGEITLDRSGWVLPRTRVVQGTRYSIYPNQVATMSAFGGKAPELIEEIALNFFEYVRFKTFLCGQNLQTYSRTATTVIVNNAMHHVNVRGLASSGLDVYFDSGQQSIAAAFSCRSSPAVIGTEPLEMVL
jgi:hypothetical protein